MEDAGGGCHARRHVRDERSGHGGAERVMKTAPAAEGVGGAKGRKRKRFGRVFFVGLLRMAEEGEALMLALAIEAGASSRDTY